MNVESKFNNTKQPMMVDTSDRGFNTHRDSMLSHVSAEMKKSIDELLTTIDEKDWF